MSAAAPTRAGTAAGLAIALVYLAAPLPSIAVANGGELRVANAEVGSYRVSVFTDPTPVDTRELHVSVLVTIPGTEGTADGLRVSIHARHPASGTVRTAAATRSEAEDPRYYAAHIEPGIAGEWEVRVDIEGDRGAGTVAFRIDAGRPGPLSRPIVWIPLALLPLLLLAGWVLRGSSVRSP